MADGGHGPGSGASVGEPEGNRATSSRAGSAAASTAIAARLPWWRRRSKPLETERFDPRVVRRLVLGSALMLFLELALIRWLGANVVHL